MPNIDLHMHSIFSDGTYTPAELVAYAKQKGLSALSLTDHDTIDGLDEARQHAISAGIRFLNGIEINSFFILNSKRVNIHVLGYGFDPEALQPYTEQLKKLRYEHNDAIRKALQKLGIEITDSDLGLQSTPNTITRLNFAKALVQKGYAETVKEALTKYLHRGGSAFVEYNTHPFSTVAKMIHDAGGIVSLAHPAEYKLENTDTEHMINSMIQEGLDAVECIHPSQDSKYARMLMDIAVKKNLFQTGGSDFHGPNESGIDLGFGGDNMVIPESFLSTLLNRSRHVDF
ncbi:MAG: PHP domain-containing protein [Lachnospiraceae bacterium]|nr:PHP domain-containing protein [Lachnospiraceae bacterium]